ncbi:hypothetical protein [Lutibacter flavus]|uniref:Lipoprotein n=1 Tax=Lutibacter flavus TaxID=691689 RepID=A0A238WWD0_9FLAO|nr:hypothetical protein [Lutibacter flavus]SNR50842.1 hypothetical protein SAMN04488111_1276 [Lutibacter flavus]
MKIITPLFLVITVFTISCNSQEKTNDIIINYTAQTRGYIYSLQLENNTLEINDNNAIKKVELSEKQQIKIDSLLNSINFSEIENNISIDDLAVDKAIKGTFNTYFKEKVFEYEFDHNKLPKDIQELFKRLEAYLN